jgi:hypothetical protein
MILAITKFLIWCCEKTGRTLTITGTAGPDDVYLIRYYVVRSSWFNIFIHRFLRSDRDDLHDHPWNFCTYLVSGSYAENRWNEEKKVVERTYRFNYPDDGWGEHRENTLVYRRATDQHQVVVGRELKLTEKNDAALTICVTGPTIRNWGFIKEVTTQKDGKTPISEKYRPIREWIDWRTYLGLPPDAPGRG